MYIYYKGCDKSKRPWTGPRGSPGPARGAALEQVAYHVVTLLVRMDVLRASDSVCVFPVCGVAAGGSLCKFIPFGGIKTVPNASKYPRGHLFENWFGDLNQPLVFRL